MGYETKLYIGEIFKSTHENRSCFLVSAMLDLSKIADCHLANVPRNKPIYFYGSDGNTIIDKDKYDSALLAGNIQDALDALTKDRKDSYGRFEWAYRLIKAMSTRKKGKHCRLPTHFFLFGY